MRRTISSMTAARSKTWMCAAGAAWPWCWISPTRSATTRSPWKTCEPVRRQDQEGLAALIFHTGWDKVSHDPHYFGEQPYLWVDLPSGWPRSGVICVALDTPTTYPAEYPASHHSLLNKHAEVLIIEGLRGLERLQSKQVILIALPLRIRGRDGSPCRAVAIDGDIEPLKPLFESWLKHRLQHVWPISQLTGQITLRSCPAYNSGWPLSDMAADTGSITSTQDKWHLHGLRRGRCAQGCQHSRSTRAKSMG